MFWRRSKTLERKLGAWIREGGPLQTAIGDAAEVKTAADARMVCAALDQASSPESIEGFEAEHNLHSIIALFQSVGSREALETLREAGLPRLRALLRRYLEHRQLKADLVLFVLKQLAMYSEPRDVPSIVAVARDPDCARGWLWQVVFRESGRDAVFADALVDGLRDPLPAGFCRVAYLDFATVRAMEGRGERHPFDTPAGHRALREWLEDTDSSNFSYAVSAAASLPFIAAEARDPLLALAQRHVDALVRMESAWARAKLGEEPGFVQLIELACDPRTAASASRYLVELGAEARLPETCRQPDFRALAEMAQWLAHPNEFCRMPDAIEIATHRELYWPPTRDRRPLWVIRYEYRAGDGTLDSGYGLVGSTTWALMDEAKAGEIEPLNVYALHCCWELESNQDSRAPAERNVAAGRRLLAEHNPEFRSTGG